jgi:hypothetical protein
LICWRGGDRHRHPELAECHDLRDTPCVSSGIEIGWLVAGSMVVFRRTFAIRARPVWATDTPLSARRTSVRAT